LLIFAIMDNTKLTFTFAIVIDSIMKIDPQIYI